MRHAARGRSRPLLLAVLVAVIDPASVGAAEEQDKYEEQVLARCAERTHKNAVGERAQWIKALEAAFPDKVVHAATEEEYATWFALLAGKNEDWRRDDVQGFAELFDKVVQRLELGPVPSIKRDEFARYTKKMMRDGPGRDAPDPNEDADRVFRVLDRNADGELAPEEFTAGLKDNKLAADADGNGRLSKAEYRGYFHKRVQVRADTLSAGRAPGGDPLARGKEGKAVPGAGLPEWFATLDTDKDGQIALFEWRKAGRSIAAFTEMDLNADGLLTRDEYQRFMKQSEDKRKQQKREEQD
ncbi:EF-hand domain-containing protein [Gemmata sp. JC717]|uniref:EF-hand domain-containing protein n=1 Tax=Gemmata algarum TaxID=2975278 RepID=UPI0021BB022B|nr:EF-hand domain-containing protein [Gemmata algarum]MDY3553849.1 EF-hand domain-containing protein [Gemmata algarum]